ncbi:hypothetical protein CEXT_99271 [Caerostris extrusa]|uniref:Uncharacterized protein n=1 Tax=Caerostris extrusa TaxID=172846 RepID=A0AAV4XKB0_CAEEX|nr:hypothetical protein CEXT_99271 [Caerostris extrusa]
MSLEQTASFFSAAHHLSTKKGSRQIFLEEGSLYFGIAIDRFSADADVPRSHQLFASSGRGGRGGGGVRIRRSAVGKTSAPNPTCCLRT